MTNGAGGLVGAVFFAGRSPSPPRRASNGVFHVLLVLGLAITFWPAVSIAQTYETAYDSDGIVLVNGERRFVLGAYTLIRRTKEADYGSIMRECADAGFNLAYVSGSSAEEQAEAAAAHGLMTWTNVGAPSNSNEVSKLRKRLIRATGLPALAIIETVDEPAWTLQKPERRVPPEAVIRAYAIIKELAPNRLVYTNHAPTNLVSTLTAYNPGTDIVAVDVYPVIPHGLVIPGVMFSDGLQGDFNNPYISQVGEYMRKMRRVAGPGRPVFSVQQAFAWAMLLPEQDRDPDTILYPTFHQSRFMAYQAIIEGASGVLYWGAFLTPKPSPHWDRIKRVVRELADLEPVLSAASVSLIPEIRYHELGHSVDDGVGILIKDTADGARYLITCNADRYSCHATLSGFGQWELASVLNESRTLDLEYGTLTDVWLPYSVHVYRLER